MIPDLKNSRLEVVAYADKSDLSVSAIAKDGFTEVGKTQGTTNKAFYTPIRNPKTWSPDNPFLYDLKLQLKDRQGKVIDEIDSYFGMRSVTIEKVGEFNRILLNFISRRLKIQ